MSPHEQPAAGRRVHWLELLFDLVMVAYISQVAHTMHGSPTPADGLAFAVLLALGWWAWINASVTMNLFGARITPTIWVAVGFVMIAIGFIAAAVPEAFTERAGAFALGNAVIRLVWMYPWLVKRRVTGAAWWRPWLYCFVPAALWTASVWAPGPWRYVLWTAATVLEVALLVNLGRGSAWVGRAVDIDHLIERVSLLVVIVFGESVLSIISELSAHWAPAPALAALLGLMAVIVLAWMFFTLATVGVEAGLRRLRDRGSVGALRDTVMYLPVLLIAGIVLFAAGVGTAVADAAGRLPIAAAVCIAVGICLFFLASIAESLRYGAAWRDVIAWGPAGAVLPWLLVPLSVVLTATGLIAASLLIIVACVTLSVMNTRRVRRRARV